MSEQDPGRRLNRSSFFAKHELNPWRVLVHIVSFCVLAGIGAILVYPAYPTFELETDTPAEARDAYLTAVVIIGCLGPGITAAIFGLLGVLQRGRAGKAGRE